MNRVIVTGATGYFGKEFVRQLSEKNRYELIIATSDTDKAKSLFCNNNIKIISNVELISNWGGCLEESAILVHAAFCRRSEGAGLSQSLDFSRQLFQTAIDCNVGGIINLSSQSVYGSGKEELGNEETATNPGYLYAISKYASEELLNEAIYFSKGRTKGCNVRLASLMGATDRVPDNVLYKFICSALKGDDISIVGGTQKFSFLDVHDAVRAVIRLIEKGPSDWAPIYNLGPESQVGIVEMAELVRDRVKLYTGKEVKIKIQPDQEHTLNAGMDCSKLYRDLQWKPAMSFSDIVEDTVRFVIKDTAENKN